MFGCKRKVVLGLNRESRSESFPDHCHERNGVMRPIKNSSQHRARFVVAQSQSMTCIGVRLALWFWEHSGKVADRRDV